MLLATESAKLNDSYVAVAIVIVYRCYNGVVLMILVS